MTDVAVCIPTVPERADMCERTIAAYLAQSDGDELFVEVGTISGHTWGGGCNELAGHTIFASDYLLFGCDDAVPHPGAVAAAVRFHVETGDLPGCRFLEAGVPLDPSYDARPHGQETPWCRLFLLPPAVYQQVGPLLDLTWYTDIHYCQRLNEHGYRIRMCDGFTFDHLDPPRTWAVNGEVERQHAVYREACAAAGRSPLA